MRFLFLILAAALTASAGGAAPIQGKSQKPADCPATSRYEAAQRGEVAQFSRLGDLPAAEAYKAALLMDGRGCEAPIIIRYDIGAPNPDKHAR
jgi:hypothetical protein